MNISQKEVILASGKKIMQYTLVNDQQMCVEILSLGATLTKICVPDYEGKIENVILGWQDLNLYEEHPGNFGAVVGRVAGRIYKGQITLNQKLYELPINALTNTLHGGVNGFHKKDWMGEMSQTVDEVTLKLTYLSEDGEEGFPGNLKTSVIYRLNNQNQLTLEYEATTDQETVVNLTNHAYFNLSGEGKRDILGQEVFMDSDTLYALDETLIPTGKMISVEEKSCFNFKKAKALGKDIEEKDEMLVYGRGYDHIWKLNQGNEAIKLYDPISRRVMTVTTTASAVVMYTMNYASDPYKLSNGALQKPRDAVCFETQEPAIGYNEINKQEIILKPGEKYSQQTVFTFTIA